MPVHRGKDSKGCFYQWGQQTKYYYTVRNKSSREQAKRQAEKQARAIYASGYKKK